jgi:hypothetical protein
MELALFIKIVIGVVAFAVWVAGKLKAEAGQPSPIAVPPARAAECPSNPQRPAASRAGARAGAGAFGSRRGCSS